MSQEKKSAMRLPPYSEEAEKAVLGSMMINADVILDITEFLRSEMFYSERARMVFNAISELVKKSAPIDALSVSELLSSRGELERAGGSTYIADLTTSVPSSLNAVHYGQIVFKKFMMRSLIGAAEFIHELGWNEAEELEQLLDKAEKKVYDIANYSVGSAYIHLKDELSEVWNRFDQLHSNEKKLRGVSTGFTELDGMLSGFQESDLVILAARPSMGKTALALDMVRHSAINSGTKACIFSLEMSKQQLADRMVAAQAQIDAWKLRTGQFMKDEEYAAFHQALNDLSKADIYINDQPAVNVMYMRSIARKLKREKGLDVVVIDYLQLMTPLGNFKSDSTVQQVTEISRSLKHLARDLKVPVIALSQLSRAVEQRGGRPRLSDLRDSGSIEQDADVVMFIHREDKYKEQAEKNNIAEILIEKHRNGATGAIQLYFNDKKVTFQSISKGGSFGGAEQDFANF